MISEGIGSWAPPPLKSRILVDFSSPNVAKEMHVGHLRSTILGDIIARTLEFTGAEVLRINHIGDWGTQFGMLIQHMSESRPEGLGEEGGSEEDVADLQNLYRAARVRFDSEEDFKMRSQQAVRTLQSGDAQYIAAWKRICAASRKQFRDIYRRLNVELVDRGESFYNPFLAPLVGELKEGGYIEEWQGAQCIFVDNIKVPFMVQKSDGGFGYAATDLAALKYRLTEDKADWILYVTDVGQSQHFQQLFGAARKIGLLTDGECGVKVDHITFGLVLGEDGKRLKTRSGTAVRLADLLDEAKARCRAAIKERWDERGEYISEEDLEDAASAMGYGAVKYADLKNNRMSNYRFSYDEMLHTKGNTAVYLMYAYARLCGILRNTERDVVELAANEKIVLEHEKEVALALQIARFPEAVERTIRELLPNRLCEYLCELSNVVNGFHCECQVIGSEREASRLLLCQATVMVKRACFKLLGISPLNRI
ncbi:unnamed protein product [Ostreobium quekettii]|uniref:arginine--tRNA ligase n=1 Tax=Ostreobium quekettii TaxID=121088 RepID=A0A8S1J3I1_9CHLO|nr:unnamed protein product [Ostreobium quekettii]|eukprot:evm.model.scf_1847.4 EVM.evm.TU.scf_1847.4   scf_1847:28214-32630(-)